MKKILSVVLSLLLLLSLASFAFAEEPADPAEPAHEHVWGAWEIDVPADYGVSGQRHRVCEDCGETETGTYEIDANRFRDIQFTMMKDSYYRVYMGRTTRLIYKDGKPLRWYAEASLRFTVELRKGFKYQTYVVYMNGEAVAPEEDGSYAIPANSGRVVVSAIPASYPGDEYYDPPVGVTEVSERICSYCGIDHGNDIIGRLIGFWHAIKYEFERAMGRR